MHILDHDCILDIENEQIIKSNCNISRGVVYKVDKWPMNELILIPLEIYCLTLFITLIDFGSFLQLFMYLWCCILMRDSKLNLKTSNFHCILVIKSRQFY